MVSDLFVDYLLLTYRVKCFCCVVLVRREHKQPVSATAVSAVVSNGTQLADEHRCTDPQRSRISILSVRLHWSVATES